MIPGNESSDRTPTGLSDVIQAALDTHRWKSMGVSSVACECGEILYGSESLTQFPADEAFRAHIAEVITAEWEASLPEVVETVEWGVQTSDGVTESFGSAEHLARYEIKRRKSNARLAILHQVHKDGHLVNRVHRSRANRPEWVPVEDGA